MKEHHVNELNNFIGGWYLSDTTICDDIIDYFNSSSDKAPGKYGKGYNSKHKDSVDVQLFGDLKYEYIQVLRKITAQYVEKYPFCNEYGSWGIVENINIQYYKPTAGFHGFHTERTSYTSEHGVFRHLVFMTYLNDVTDSGETDWLHQKIKIKPEKGLTVIWPVDWTFTHRGITSLTQEKYIVTGWFSFTQE
jgi:hypothetical protein